tara:strand:+ start:4009 stop:4656 length:648 start_codon:yes stop_codon:yes gene_type:complete
MLKENQLSTILLLALVGFVIYQLMQPTTIKNKGTVIVEESEEDSVMKRNPLVVGNGNETVMEMIPEEIVSSEEQPNVESDSEEEVSEELSINKFTGNQESDRGAVLDEAFKKPVAESSSTDKVDFNKNLVKKYNVKDYLPQEVNQEWFDYDIKKTNAGSDKMINTDRYVIGVNTVGQSLRNASYDLRTAPPNPKFTVGPWNNSTIEADYNIKPLC